MVHLKNLSKEIAVIIYFIAVLICLAITFFGCSSAPQIIERPVIVEVPAIKDSIVLRDSVIYKDSVLVDSLWYGEVTDSLGKVIGDLKVYFKSKIAELKLNERKDTIIIKDTVQNNNASNPILPILTSAMSWWEQTILYGGIGLILALLIMIRTKTGKIL